MYYYFRVGEVNVSQYIKKGDMTENIVSYTYYIAHVMQDWRVRVKKHAKYSNE